MERSRIILLCYRLSPRAFLPLSSMNLFSLFTASALWLCACSSPGPASPDVPGSVTRIEWAVRPPGGDGARSGTRAGDWYLIRRMDLFVFDDDGIGALDAYTRSFSYSPSAIEIRSAEGPKRVVAIANHPLPDGFVTSVGHYEDLKKIVADLTEDDPSCPVMSGEARFTAGAERSCSVTLEPVLSAVEIHSLTCKMEGAWAGMSLERVKVYLTGVSCRADLLRTEGFLPTETLNNGGLSEHDMARLPYSGMVYRFLGNGRPSGGRTSYGTASLYCYPDEAEEETPGSPFTRLVVEGTLDGTVCYYAFPINRSGGEEGIGRNRRYVFDLTLTRPGTESPDVDAPITP